MPLGFSNPDNQEGLWASSNYTPIRPAEDADFEVITIECWKYESQNSAPTVRHKTERLSIGSIDSWLEEPYPSCEGRSLSSGFKILLMPTDGLLLPPMTEKGLNSINTALGLPHVHKHSASLSSGANGMFLQRDKSYVFVFRKTSSYSSISVILRYNPLRNVTQGVFHFEPMGIPLHYFDKLISQFSACSHPLLLPLIAVEITFELTACLLLRPALITLREIEGQTGYDINAHGDDKINLSDDLRALIQRLGDGQSKLFSALSTIRSARLSTEFIQGKLRHLNKVLPDEVKGRLEHPSDLLEERIEYLLSNMENALLYEGITERMETQQTVVFNLIAQLDGMVNIGLAKDSKEIAAASKRDSSAMKIVAVLTTFFLPGTFVATLFAMPLFNWSEGSIKNVANHHFWIYWAVTGPLTIAIMVGVASWAFYHSRHAERLAQLARESVGSGLTEGKQEREEKAAHISTSGKNLDREHPLLRVLKRRHGHSKTLTGQDEAFV